MIDRREFLAAALAVAGVAALGNLRDAERERWDAYTRTLDRDELVAWANVPGRLSTELTERLLPELSSDDRNSVLWEYTGWPGFFNGDPVTCLVDQLLAFRRGEAS